MKRDPGAGDRRRAGAAVGLEHVAIDDDLPLAERGKIGDGAERAADQALDLLGAARLLAAQPPRAASARVVARGSMPYSAVTQPRPCP